MDETSQQPFCNAPGASLYFDQFGQAKACCQQSQYMPLGDVANGGIVEVWNSKQAKNLRLAMTTVKLDAACGFCSWQRQHAPADAVFARTFDHLPQGDHKLPQQLEFAISSVCNLQCVMCDGDFSSSIRVHREGRPPRPEVYQDAFYRELAEIMPHVPAVQFYGGEPLLARPSLRVLDIVADTNPHASVTMTTNATVWNRRVESVLTTIQPSLVVSLDGMSPTTYEGIRKGASLDTVVKNIDRYERAGAQISLTFCLMTENWHEFADLLEFATERSFDVGVNTVLRPEPFSLYSLEADELRRVIDEMEAQEHRISGLPLYGVWRQKIRELDGFLNSESSQLSIRQGSTYDTDILRRTDDPLHQTAPGTDLPAGTVEILFHDETTAVVTGPCSELLGVTSERLTGLDVVALTSALSVVDSKATATRPRAIMELTRSDGLPPLQAAEHSDRWWITRL